MGNANTPEDGFSAGAAMTRAEVVEAWRAHRQSRRSSGEAGERVDGFALRKWRKAGVFGPDAVRRVERVLHLLLRSLPEESEGPDRAAAVIRECLAGEPTGRLLTAVRALLEGGDPELIVDVLTVVHEEDLPWLSLSGTRRLAFASATTPDAVPAEARLSSEEDTSGAFALYGTVARGVSPDELSAQQLRRVLEWAPLGVIDDLIDAGAVGREHEPWVARADEAERNYLMARLAPERVDADMARAIGWNEPVERELFLAGEPLDPEEGTLYDLLLRVADGETEVMKGLEDLLPRDLVLRLRKVQEGSLTGSWSPDIASDRGLWRLMSALWEPRAAVSPARGPLYALIALRHAYDLICRGAMKKASIQVDKLVEHEKAPPRQGAESWNMYAYLALVEEDLETAGIALARIASSDHRARLNLALVDRRRATKRNDRDHPANPYLELGLPHQTEAWRHQYRERRRDAKDLDDAARVNWAKTRIEQAEHSEDWSDFFVLPLDSTEFELPVVRPLSLVPPSAPMPRRTASGSETDLTTVRHRAMVDLLPAFLTAPRRPDHDHRTTS